MKKSEFNQLINPKNLELKTWEVYINESLHRRRYKNSKSLFSMKFFERFYKYIPLNSMEKSRLWEIILEDNMVKLIEKILAQ